jgi:cytochrome oxidase Cu insertion factor (SCO1/SenC/PrrC family)
VRKPRPRSKTGTEEETAMTITRMLRSAIVPLLLLAAGVPGLSRPHAPRPAIRASEATELSLSGKTPNGEARVSTAQKGESQRLAPERNSTGPQRNEAAPERNETGVLAEHIPNACLFDQNGKKLRLQDLLNDNVVVINFIYTSCSAFCGMQAASFARLQKFLADRNAGRVNLISITTDPNNDTPARLKKWARDFGWKPGWILLTGRPEELDPVLFALTGDKGRQGMHSTIALIANSSRGIWIRTDSLSPPEELAGMIDSVRGSNSTK